jgi:hypothetical protein
MAANAARSNRCFVLGVALRQEPGELIRSARLVDASGQVAAHVAPQADHAHAEGAGAQGQGLANGSEPDNPQSPPTDLVEQRLFLPQLVLRPLARALIVTRAMNLAHQGEHHCHHVLGHGLGVHAAGVGQDHRARDQFRKQQVTDAGRRRLNPSELRRRTKDLRGHAVAHEHLGFAHAVGEPDLVGCSQHAEPARAEALLPRADQVGGRVPQRHFGMMDVHEEGSHGDGSMPCLARSGAARVA